MAESADSPMHQEILLGGHLYLMVLKVWAMNIITSCDNSLCHVTTVSLPGEDAGGPQVHETGAGEGGQDIS